VIIKTKAMWYIENEFLKAVDRSRGAFVNSEASLRVCILKAMLRSVLVLYIFINHLEEMRESLLIKVYM